MVIKRPPSSFLPPARCKVQSELVFGGHRFRGGREKKRERKMPLQKTIERVDADKIQRRPDLRSNKKYILQRSESFCRPQKNFLKLFFL